MRQTVLQRARGVSRRDVSLGLKMKGKLQMRDTVNNFTLDFYVKILKRETSSDLISSVFVEHNGTNDGKKASFTSKKLPKATDA